MEWKYGPQQGKGLPPGISIYDDEKFSMRKFGKWTVDGAEKVKSPDQESTRSLKSAKITKDQVSE